MAGILTRAGQAVVSALTPDRFEDKPPVWGLTLPQPATGPTLHSVAREPGAFLRSLDPRTPAGIANLGMMLLPGGKFGGPRTEQSQWLADIYKTSRGLPAETGYRTMFGKPQGYLNSQKNPRGGGYTTDFGGPGSEAWAVGDLARVIGTMLRRKPGEVAKVFSNDPSGLTGISRATSPGEVMNPLLGNDVLGWHDLMQRGLLTQDTVPSAVRMRSGERAIPHRIAPPRSPEVLAFLHALRGWAEENTG